jgi:hypothetical protein
MLSADERDDAQAEIARLRVELARTNSELTKWMASSETSETVRTWLASKDAEIERLRVIIHGMQDGALVRDQGALIDRLRAKITAIAEELEVNDSDDLVAQIREIARLRAALDKDLRTDLANVRAAYTSFQSDVLSYSEEAKSNLEQQAGEIRVLRTDLAETRVLLGGKLDVARQDAEYREAWIETLNNSHSINMQIMTEERDAARQDASEKERRLEALAEQMRDGDCGREHD